MKRKLLTLAVILALIVPLRAQEKEEKLKELEKLEQQAAQPAIPDTLEYEEEEEIVTGEEWVEEQDTSRLKIGDIVTVEDTDDETVIRIGKRDIRIDDENDRTGSHSEDYDDEKEYSHSRQAFKGHLGGIEFAFNGFSTDTWGRIDEPVEGWLDLNTTRSSAFNIVAPPVNLGFSRRFGLVTGLGISFNNYFFDGNNSVAVGEEGITGPVYPPSEINYEKSKLATLYGILPVMLEVQIPVSHSGSINLGAGVIGAVKLGSHTKTVYYSDGKQKEKNHDDFNLNVLRYGVTARAGYEMVQVYGTCYLSPMFEKNKGPELFPFEVGIALTIND